MAKSDQDRIAELQTELGELRAARAQDKKALETREHENRDFRTKIKELELKVTDLSGLIPAEGMVVLSSDDATSLTEYREFGDLTSVKTKLEELEESRQKAEKLERRDILRGVAEAEGWKLPVLEDQLNGVPLKVAEEDDKEVVQVTQSGKSPLSVRDFIEQNRADYLPALQAAPTAPRAPTGPGPSDPPAGSRLYTQEEIAQQKRAEVSL
jgi:hypothetical protein